MDRNKRRTNRGHQTAGEMAHTIARTVEGASFTAGASALVVVLARWLAERGERPVHDAEV